MTTIFVETKLPSGGIFLTFEAELGGGRVLRGAGCGSHPTLEAAFEEVANILTVALMTATAVGGSDQAVEALSQASLDAQTYASRARAA